MDIVEVACGGRQAVTTEDEEGIADALRDLARWLYRRLEREYEYQISNTAADEAILSNEYTFTQEGRRFGRWLNTNRASARSVSSVAS